MEEDRKRIWMEDIKNELKISDAARLCELPKTNAGGIRLMFAANPSGGWHSGCVLYESADFKQTH